MDYKITGSATIIKNTKLQGWFFNKDAPDTHLIAELYINHKKIDDILCKEYREDLVKKEIHKTGKVGFSYKVDIEELDHIHIYFPDYKYQFIVQKGFELTKNIEKKELCTMHIGMHKTGSSSIQYNLSRNSYSTFSYFNLEAENHSIPLFSLFSKKPEQYHIHRRNKRTKEDVEKYNKRVEKLFIQHLIANEEYQHFVISGEDISMLPLESIAHLKSFLFHYFKKVQIIAYVRSPLSYMSSTFQENVKAGLADFQVENTYPYYRLRFEKFYKVFGEKYVSLIHFDKKNLYCGDVVHDFLKRVGEPITCEKVYFNQINQSLSKEATCIFYLFNKVVLSNINDVLEREKTRIALLNILMKIGTDKFKLNNTLVQKIIKKHESDIEWIEEKLGKNIFNETVSNIQGVNNEYDIIKFAKNAINTLTNEEKMEIESIIDLKSALQTIQKLEHKDVD